MSNLAIYRRYRPKNFSEVTGQKKIVETLKNALESGRISHAYLFCGQRGTGKTTMARLLAKAINCLDLKKSEPCNQCESCLEINAGKSIDLIEIDAASNRGIDEIRQLKDGIRFAPVKSKKKIFIIDEVHMLTKEAFNALLKTLEEPPEHALFILATTEPEKLPATIISRTQRFDFKKFTITEITERLIKITESEKTEIDPMAAKEIALAAEGSLRDAESMLDQILALNKGKIGIKELENSLGRIDFFGIYEFLNLLAEKEIDKTIKTIGKIYENGINIQEFIKSTIKFLRKILLIKISPETVESFKEEITEEQIKSLIELGKKLNEKEIKKMMEIFLTALENQKISPLPTLALEIAAVEICEKNN